MQREEFETRIRELLPGASETALDHMASYAEELERETEECARAGPGEAGLWRGDRRETL